ncbi:MAG: hypothetical protein J6K45_00540 [Clostridia bacterium]|nr:hypothetical protein [Clostridia bacterium]
MNYDEILKKEFRDIAIIEYGIIKGNSTIVFIKAGQDGSIYGYENKYLTIAKKLNEKYGYTVISSSNPFDGNNPLDHDMNVVKEYCVNNNIEDYKVYYMGQSNGARIGISWGYQHPEIKKLLLINSPIFINWHILKNGIIESNNQEMILVYGDKDNSYRYVELIKPLLTENKKLVIVNGADHNFVNMLDEFIDLPIKYFK